MVSNFKTSGIDLDNTFANRAWFQKSNFLFSWGGRFGNNTDIASSSPVQISSVIGWKDISAAGHSGTGTGPHARIAIKTDGTLWSWGSASTARLGLNDRVERSSPTQVGTDTNWKSVSCGISTVGAIKTDGTLWIWGQNSTASGTAGILGLSSTISRSSPTQIGTDANWNKISVSADHVLAIKANGSLWSWGRNNEGSLGLNDTTFRSSPTQVGADTNWSLAVSHSFVWFNSLIPANVGFPGSLAIKTDGTLWSWGGLQSSPVQVGTDTNWKTVDSGRGIGGSGSPNTAFFPNTFAVKTTGTLWALNGSNTFGVLGLNDTVARSSPVQIGTLSDWTDIKTNAGNLNYQSTIGLKTDGTLWSWGRGNGTAATGQNGVLGLNDIINRSSPTQIGDSTGWKLITNGPMAVLESSSFIQ
jgi:alpha-tubulin suppressor-like RCC1 family protein